MNDPRGGGSPAPEAYDALRRAAASVAARVERRLAPAGFTASQVGTLAALLADGPLCPHDLARRLVMTRGNVSQIVIGLERRGLVERRRDDANRRFCVVRLTTRGRRLAGSLASRRARAVTAAMAALGADKLRFLTKLCARLGSPMS